MDQMGIVIPTHPLYLPLFLLPSFQPAAHSLQSGFRLKVLHAVHGSLYLAALRAQRYIGHMN